MATSDRTQIKTAGGVILALDRLARPRHAVLVLAYGPHISNVILDADDVAALGDACTVLAEEMAEGKQGEGTR